MNRSDGWHGGCVGDHGHAFIDDDTGSDASSRYEVVPVHAPEVPGDVSWTSCDCRVSGDFSIGRPCVFLSRALTNRVKTMKRTGITEVG